MKKQFLLGLSLLVMICSVAFSFKNEVRSYKLEVSNSAIKWTGKKVSGKHWGTVALKDGNFKTEGGKLIGGEFVINMNTITVDDIKNEEYNAKLKGHLQSEDFFSVEKFPEAKFVITKAQPKKSENGNYEITGDLTIKGITNSISFPAQLDINGSAIQGNADLKFDRTKWNIRYGSGNFFTGLGDNMIYDDVELSVTIAAK